MGTMVVEPNICIVSKVKRRREEEAKGDGKLANSMFATYGQELGK